MSMASEWVIELEGVSLEREGQPILREVSWRVARGEIAALVGPNGSGKSTLVAVVTGYCWPGRGSVRVLGRRYGETDLGVLRQRIGIIETSRAPQLVQGLTVREAVATGLFSAFLLLRPEQVAPEQWRRIDEEIDRQGLGSLRQRPYRLLSTGERARTLLARALVSEPELLILDEPAAGLDIAGRYAFVRLLERLAERPQAPSLVLVTHHLDELPAGTGSVALMHGGRIICQGAPAAVLTGVRLSEAFGCPIEVSCQRGYYAARVTGPAGHPGNQTNR